MRTAALDDDSSTDLNADGRNAVLWLALVDGTTRERLSERLAQIHLVEGGRVATDVDAFRGDLRRQGLFEEL